MFDTHCHLQSEQFEGEVESILSRAQATGVTHFLIPAIDAASIDRTLDLALQRENTYCGLGIHPHHASEWNDELAGKIEDLHRTQPKVRAIGEIGIDYHYDFAPKETQRQVFREQIELAQRLSKPIIVHTRESDDDVWNILHESYSDKPANLPRGQLHCFSGTVEMMQKAVDLGFYVSFTGNITFKKSTLSDVVREAPLDRILLETDSPYLAPVPYRGKRNSPEYLGLVAAKVAEIKNIEVSEVMKQTLQNAFRLFLAPVAALLLLMLFAPGLSKAQPGRSEPVGSRPPDSVMTPERRKAEELLKKQREELEKEAAERKQDSVRSAARDQQEAIRKQQTQMREDSLKAAERIADEERQRLKLLTPLPWKAIAVEGGVGVGNMQMQPVKITPTSVFAYSLGLGTQLTRILDVSLTMNRMTVSTDLTADTLYNAGYSGAPTTFRGGRGFNPGEKAPTFEAITITGYSIDFRFVINPKTTFKFYAGGGYTYLTLNNRQEYHDIMDTLGTRSEVKELAGFVNRGAIKLLFGIRYDIELSSQLTLTPFAQIAALAGFQGAQPNGSFIFGPDPEQLTMTHLNVGASLAFGWFGVPRIK